jgi:hypothetical protein
MKVGMELREAKGMANDRLIPAILKRLMRHAEVGTTMKYYVMMDADSVDDGPSTKYSLRLIAAECSH